MDNSSKQLESTESILSPLPSHSFVMKKKERTPEEGSKAIYRMAVIAAIDSTKGRRSTTDMSNTLSFEPSPVTTELLSPASLDRTPMSINCSSIESENKPADDDTDLDDQGSPLRMFEDREALGVHSETKKDRRVGQLTSGSLYFTMVLFAYVRFQVFYSRTLININFLVCYLHMFICLFFRKTVISDNICTEARDISPFIL